MRWDLGVGGVLYLALVSLLFGVVAASVVRGGWDRKVRAARTTAAACLIVGLLVSEGLFGWATEEELQPNVDGLSRDEILLSSVLTTLLVVLAFRYAARRAEGPTSPSRRTPAHRR